MSMSLMETQRRRVKSPKRPDYVVYKRRRRVGFLLILLVALAVWGLGASLFSVTAEEAEDGRLARVIAPTLREAPVPIDERVAEEKAAEEEEARTAAAAPDDPTLYLTVPRLGLYSHTVRNDRSEEALGLGAVKLPDTGFPWEQGDTNTYIACHRLGFPGTESYNQCLNLPSMRQGDEVFLQDTKGRTYKYQVSESLNVAPEDTWVANPVAGKDVVSLQTCTETLDDYATLGPNWAARFIVRADRVS